MFCIGDAYYVILFLLFCVEFNTIDRLNSPRLMFLWFICIMPIQNKVYLILSYLILSYLILSYLILSYLILSYLILSYLILSYLILSYLI